MQIYFDYILHSFKKSREVLGLQFFSVYYLSERSDVKKVQANWTCQDLMP